MCDGFVQSSKVCGFFKRKLTWDVQKLQNTGNETGEARGVRQNFTACWNASRNEKRGIYELVYEFSVRTRTGSAD